MNRQQTVLTALGCAGSLAAVLAVASPAVASTAASSASADDSLPTLTHADDNPIVDALGCGCARCMMGETLQPTL
ncbi:MAG: hypothetical protein AB8B99_07450 [Phormidesmis sp.]